MSLSIRRLELQNWKNFRRLDVEIGDRLFLVGPNASGKSNLLDVFRFLRDLASSGGGLQEAVRRRGGVKAMRCLAARSQPAIQVRVSLEAVENGKWAYDLALSQDKQGRPTVHREVVTHDGVELLIRPDAEDRTDRARLTQTFLEQVNANKPFRSLASFFASVRYLHIVPQLIRDPARSVGRARDPYGGDFLEQVAKTVEKTRKARLRRIQDALRVAVPQLREIEQWRDEAGTPHLRGKYEHWRPQGAWQTEEQFSDGTLRLMGLLWVIMDGNGPLLLEEPELSLHPGIIRFLPQMFARLQRRSGRQIFVSTHSRELLQDEGIGLDEVLLLVPDREGTSVTLARSLTDIKELLAGGLSLGDAVIPKTDPQRAQQLALFGDV